MKYTFESKPEWGFYTGFVPNKKRPVYNWFYYKEGFSRELVVNALEILGVKDGKILDPFCGSGTGLLACKEMQMESIGFDIQPSSLLAARVKTRDYSEPILADIITCIDDMRKEEFEKIRKSPPPIVRRVFPRHNLDDLLFVKNMIDRFTLVHAREFLLIALINAAMKCSWAWKDGGLIRVEKRPVAPLKKMFFRVASRMLKEAMTIKGPEPLIRAEDARDMPLQDDSISCIITSPPYLNQIDYTKVYAVENWIAGGGAEEPMRSFMGLGSEDAFMPWLPAQAAAYFSDMQKFLKEAYRVCKIGAKIAIILGNAYFPPPNSPVECDTIMAGLAEQTGFQIDKIIVLNERAALRQRTEKVGVLRESMILMRK